MVQKRLEGDVVAPEARIVRQSSEAAAPPRVAQNSGQRERKD